MSGSEYDLDPATLSPDGKIFQIEYADKAVDKTGTIIGIKCTDGVLLASEKVVNSTMSLPHSDKRIFHVSKNSGAAINGVLPDGRNIVQRARSESTGYKNQFSHIIPGHVLAIRLSMYMHQYTLYSSYRPFGTNVLVATHDHINGFALHMLEPSGASYSYLGCASGRGRQTARNEIERLDLSKKTVREAAYFVAKILLTCFEESKDKKHELEMSWITAETNFEHQMVPQEFLDEQEERAKSEIEKDQMDMS